LKNVGLSVRPQLDLFFNPDRPKH